MTNPLEPLQELLIQTTVIQVCELALGGIIPRSEYACVLFHALLTFVHLGRSRDSSLQSTVPAICDIVRRSASIFAQRVNARNRLCRLPPEILAEIAQDLKLQDIISLSHTCIIVRSVLLSTSSLWTNIACKSTAHDAPGQLLQRTQAPVQFDFDMKLDEMNVRSVVDALQPHFHRCRRLTLRVASKMKSSTVDYLWKFMTSEPAPALRVFVVKDPHSVLFMTASEDPLFAGDAPLLRTLKLRSVLPLNATCGGLSITNLAFTPRGAFDFEFLMENFPRIRSLALDLSDSRWMTSEEFAVLPPHLRNVIIRLPVPTTTIEPSATALLQSLSHQSLERIVLHNATNPSTVRTLLEDGANAMGGFDVTIRRGSGTNEQDWFDVTTYWLVFESVRPRIRHLAHVGSATFNAQGTPLVACRATMLSIQSDMLYGWRSLSAPFSAVWAKPWPELRELHIEANADLVSGGFFEAKIHCPNLKSITTRITKDSLRDNVPQLVRQLVTRHVDGVGVLEELVLVDCAITDEEAKSLEDIVGSIRCECDDPDPDRLEDLRNLLSLHA